MSTREKIKEIIKAVVRSKNRLLTNILFVFIIPLVTATFIGLCVAIGKSIVGSILSIFTQSGSSSLFEEFSDAFLLFFPILSVILLLTVIITSIKQKQNGLFSLLIITILSLTASWFFGGHRLFQRFQKAMDDQLSTSIAFADGFLKNGQTEDAVRNYKTAVFLDKYIVLWNENKNIPRYYSGIAQSYMYSETDLLRAKEYYDKALSAYEKYNSEADSEIALTHLRTSWVTSVLGDGEETLEHSMKAASFYEDYLEAEDEHTSAVAFIWVANSFYNHGQYNKACKYFDLGIPLYYDSTEWGFGDDWDAKLIAISYYIAAQSFSAAGDESRFKEYQGKYDDFIWYRDFTQAELEEYIEHFHWMNK